MSKKTGTMIAIVAAVVMAGAAVAQPCKNTASQASKACVADAWEEYHLAHALCRNTSDRVDALHCWRGANAGVVTAIDECQEVYAARLDVCAVLGGGYYEPSFDPEDFEELEGSDKGADKGGGNPYLSLVPGSTKVLAADGEIVVVHVTDRVKEVDGVPCRVVVDVAVEIAGEDEEDGDAKNGGVSYVPLEVTDDWFAQHVNGDIWYCGELSRNFEDGELADLDGSFEAGKDGARPGLLISANPMQGDVYRQEFALDEAEDLAEVVALATSPPNDAKGANGFACNGRCLQTRDFTPLEPGKEEWKYYLPGVGFVLAFHVEDGEPEDPEWLACSGDSLDVLADPACGIEDVHALRELLCELAPTTFCD